LDRFQKVSLKDKLIFTRNLGVMIASGLPISKAIYNLAQQAQNKNLINILNGIGEELQKGNALSDCLAKYPGVFDELFVNMVRVGESSGNLEEVLGILSLQLEKEHDLISKVKGAMMYPAVIIVAMIGVGILMMMYVIPQITGVFKDMNADLPAQTRFIIASSDFFQKNPMIIFGGIAILILMIKFLLGTSLGKKIIGFAAINLPFIKNIVIKVNCARFSRIYSSLIRSGVSIVETLKILSRTLTNHYYKVALEKAVEEIQKGVPLSKIIYDEKKIFPILVPQMIEVGESTGKTETVLQKLAEFYEEEVNQLTKNLSSIIEPLIMIVIGSAVGFFAVSILQPMYSVMQNIK